MSSINAVGSNFLELKFFSMPCKKPNIPAFHCSTIPIVSEANYMIQPFIAPAPHPAIRYRWTNTKNIRTGTVISMLPAIIIPQSITVAL